MKEVINSLNYDFRKHVKGETNDQPSLTIPDQTMSLRTIIERYVRGIPPDNVKIPSWDSDDVDFDDYMPDPNTLDLAERQALAEQAKDYIYNTKMQYAKDKAAAIQQSDKGKDGKGITTGTADTASSKSASSETPKEDPKK